MLPLRVWWRNIASFAASALRSMMLGSLFSMVLIPLPGRLAARRERPYEAIERAAGHIHLVGGVPAQPFGDPPRADVLRKDGRNRVRQPQNVAGVVANAAGRFGGETLAPGRGIERVPELILEGQPHPGRRGVPPEPSFADGVSGYRGFDNQVRQAAAPDQRSVFLAQDRELAERVL